MQRNKIPTLKDLAFDALVEKYGLFNMLGRGIPVPDNLSIHQQMKVAGTLEPMMIERLMPVFLQAVIDDDAVTVKKLLDELPELLLIKPEKNLVIESKLTWKKFIAETALMMAVKLKLINMFNLLISYADQLEQSDAVIHAKSEAFLALTSYKTEKNAYGFDKIILSEDYIDYIKTLIEVFKAEELPEFLYDERTRRSNPLELSDEAESAVMSLLDKLIPEKAIKLDDRIDPELLLIAADRMYEKYNYAYSGGLNSRYPRHPNQDEGFKSFAQDDAFSLRIIGLIISALEPGTAKIFCQSLFDFYKGLNYEDDKMSDRAASCKILNCGRGVQGRPNDDIILPFYRESRESRMGPGFDYICGKHGHISRIDNQVGNPMYIEVQMEGLCLAREKKFNQCKEKFLEEMKAREQNLASRHSY